MNTHGGIGAGSGEEDAPGYRALVGKGFATVALWLGGGVFVLVLIGLYRWIAHAGNRAAA